MPKLVIETDGINPMNTKIIIDNKEIGFIQEITLKANAISNTIEISAILPDLSEFKHLPDSSFHIISDLKQLLESCNVKCQLIKKVNQ